LLASAAAAPVSALTIDFNNVNNISTTSDAYLGFRAAADFWESVISTNVTVYFNIGFANLGNANIIGQTGSTRFVGFDMAETYGQLAQAGNSRLDSIAKANMSPLYAASAWYDPTVTTGAVGAITQKAKANGNGVVQNTRTTNPNFTGTAANAIGPNGVEVTSNREWDADGSRNNQDMLINSTVMKALGYTLADTDYSSANRDALGRGIDAKVTFNSTFAFDFNPIDGIGEGQIDFIGTAIHEFGHALGFVSGVDIYDTNSNIGANLDTLQGLMSTLDLFRYSDDVTGIAPGSGQVLDWSVGNSATATDNLNGRAYFSFDGATKGLSAYGGDAGYFSTGSTFGDGRQASHWMDTPYTKVPGSTVGVSCNKPTVPSRGIMDPTFSGCENGIVTALDFAAFDAMGWNLNFDALAAARNGKVITSAQALAGLGAVPEPATWALMIGGFGLVGTSLRRQRRSGYATA
jgi:hypothetical protein